MAHEAIEIIQDTRLADLPRRWQMLIDGDWCNSLTKESFSRQAPGNGVEAGTYPRANVADVDKAVKAARAAFDRGTWPQMAGVDRARVLLVTAALIRTNVEDLAFFEALESGKVITSARNEIMAVADMFEYCAGLARTLCGDAHTNLGPDLMAAIVREPIGVVAMVTPWNFPALILAQKLPYALAAGCTVVLKPSEFTSATTLMICGLLVEAGLPKGVVNCITGYGNPAGQRMLDHPDVDMISFTGSTRIGRTAIESSALGVKKVSLELGGNNAQIIFADADLTIAADACVEGAFKNAGESCNCGGRIFVERSILPQFLDQFLAFARKVRVGDPLDPKSMVGAMIHKEHKAKVQSALQDALAAGAKVLLGGIGDVPSNNGHYMDLTVLTDVAPDSAIAQAEIFGPIVTIHPFDTENEAIDAANATAYGLSAAAWTTNYQRAMRCGRRLKAGTVWINTFLSGPAELPFGGVKDSGIGRENGVAGIEEFTEMKTIQFHSGARSDLWSDGWK